MMKVQWKDLRFLRSFLSVMLILLILLSVVLLAVYGMSKSALDREVQELNRKDALNYRDRFDDILNQCDMLASSMITDSIVQFYFTAQDPTLLYSDFYTRLQGKSNTYSLRCVDSVIIYAPKYQRVYNPSFSADSYTVDQLREMSDPVDLGWLGFLDDQRGITTTTEIRAKGDTWPYYISLIKHYRLGTTEGYVIINIDLIEMYSLLERNENEGVQLFGVTSWDHVFLRKNKTELTASTSRFPELASYQGGKELSFIDSKTGLAYAQAVSSKYDYTIVAVSELDSYFFTLSGIHQRIFTWGAASLIIVVLLALLYSIRLVRPIHTIQMVLKSPLEWNKDKRRHSREVEEIAEEIVQNLQFNSQLQDELSQRLELLNRTQMLALQAQINPHFLFNTLNMICLMIERDNGDDYLGGQMIRSLSDILRYSLADRKLTTLREEMEYAGKYLSILRQRFRNFEYDLRAEDSLETCLIPKLVLQPLLENAIQHGISGSKTGKPGSIKLNIREITFTYKTGTTLPSVCIELTDNGAGIPPQRLEEVRRSIQDYSDITTAHIGLANVAQRFFLCFREEQSFLLESEEGIGTTIRICFPKISDPDAIEEQRPLRRIDMM